MVIHSKLVTYGLPLVIVLANLKKKNFISLYRVQWRFHSTLTALPSHFPRTSKGIPRQTKGVGPSISICISRELQCLHYATMELETQSIDRNSLP